jgi:hypothetical protein
MERQLAARDGRVALRWPRCILRAGDGTSIKQRGTQGTDWRVHGVSDLDSGRFSHFELIDNRRAASANRGPPMPGEVRIMHRHDARAPTLLRFRQDSTTQDDFIVRVAGRHSACLCRTAGRSA